MYTVKQIKVFHLVKENKCVKQSIHLHMLLIESFKGVGEAIEQKNKKYTESSC